MKWIFMVLVIKLVILSVIAEDITNSTSTCEEGFYFDEAKKACDPIPSLGEDCSKSKKCRDSPATYGFTKCSENNTCVCKGAIRTVNETSYCIQWPGGACKNNSECGDRDTSYCGSSKCDCKIRHVHSGKGECVKFIYGQKCDYNPSLKVQKAVAQQRLTCINEHYRCENPTEQHYDGDEEYYYLGGRHVCLTLVGAACDSPKYEYCTTGASCVNTTGTFTCECDPGYSSTLDDKCLKHIAHGETCDENRVCNNDAGVICMKGKCQCPQKDMRFDIGLQRCLSSEGEFCGLLAIGSQTVPIECGSNLECKMPTGPEVSGLKCLKIN